MAVTINEAKVNEFDKQQDDILVSCGATTLQIWGNKLYFFSYTEKSRFSSVFSSLGHTVLSSTYNIFW